MAQGDAQLETLHQQASEQYLQGEFLQALKLWRELLRLSPRDERAREGARLCEMLAKDAGVEVPRMEPLPATPEPPPAVPEAPAPAPAPEAAADGIGFGMGEELDDSLDKIDDLLGGQPSQDWMAGDAPADAAADPDAEFDFDLSDIPAAPAAAAGEEPLPALEVPQSAATDMPPIVDVESPVPEAPISLPVQPAPPEVPPASAAVDELQLRTQELLTDARACHDRGDPEAALQALSRLTILDENHEGARELTAQIRAQMEARAAADQQDSIVETPPEVPVEPAPADLNHQPIELGEDGGDGLDLDLGGGPTAAPVDADPVPSVDELAALSGGMLEGGDALETAPPELEAPTEASSGAGAARTRSKLLLVAAAAVVLLAVGGFVAMQFLSGGSSEPPESPAVALVPAAPGGGANGASAASVPSAAPAAEPVVATPPAGATVDELMSGAMASFDRGEFAAAVVGFNQVLAVDPTYPEAAQGLNLAAEKYREQKVLDEKRLTAIQAFNQGDYRNALRLFYRLPTEGAEGERVGRWIVNGWYNMAIQSLMAGDCALAESNVREASVLAPDDEGLQRAADLAMVCSETVRNRAYYAAVESLGFRGIDD